MTRPSIARAPSPKLTQPLTADLPYGSIDQAFAEEEPSELEETNVPTCCAGHRARSTRRHACA